MAGLRPEWPWVWHGVKHLKLHIISQEYGSTVWLFIQQQHFIGRKSQGRERGRTSQWSVWLTILECGGFWCGWEANEIPCPKSWSHGCRKFCNKYHRRQGIASPRLSISLLPCWDCQLDPALMVAFWHFCSLGNGLRLVFHCIWAFKQHQREMTFSYSVWTGCEPALHTEMERRSQFDMTIP